MLKYLKLFEQFLLEKKPKGAPEWHDSDAPDAEGRFKDLSIKDLAAWLIKTRNKDLKKITGSLNQQIVFNKKSDPKYAEKMEKTRKAVYRQLGREDLLKESAANDSALKKVYLATKRSSGQRWWSYKGFAGDKYFTQITENNIDKLDINPDYPILNYQSDIVNQLLKEGRIKEENIYNHPKDIKLSGSKKEFHKLVEGDDAIPKTVFSKNEALSNLKFPIIAKPSEGHSGMGIQIFDKPELLEDADEKIFDTYSEFVDKAEEHRFMNFNGKPIFWMARTPDNEKAKTGKGGANEEMSFQYERRDIKDLPKDYAKVLERFSKIYEKFPFICFDVMKSKDGKVYVIESNAQPGVPFDSTVEMYKGIYEDFYKKPIDSQSMKELNNYSKELIAKTLAKDKKRFS